MISPILESLPAIHVTIVGVVAAFFSAFAVFAFQKVQESKEKLESVIKDVEEFGTPNSLVGGSKTRFITDDGLLDWDGVARDILFRARTMFAYKSQPVSSYMRKHTKGPSSKEIIELGDDLLLLLYYTFTTYPFNGCAFIHDQKVEDQKARPFDAERLKLMAKRISSLSWCWRTGNESILELISRYSVIKEEEEVRQREKQDQWMLARMTEGSNQEGIEELTKRVHEHNQIHHPITKTNYVEIVSPYFEKILQYESQVLPVLEVALTEHKRYSEMFKVKQHSLIVIRVIAFTLAIGVCLPLITLEILHGAKYFNWDSIWFGWIEHFLLLLTMTPYFMACRHFYNKVKDWPFE